MLIATTVIYNGINIKDSAVKHIVVPFTTVSVTKQLIGRKRIEKDESVNIYFPDVSQKILLKRYHDCIREYMELIGLRNELAMHSLIQLNDLSNSTISKYYYLEPVSVSDANNSSLTMLMPKLNLPSINKLYYDTCFYIFALQVTDFISILLAHLGIADKAADVIDITVQSQKNKINKIKQELAECLENLIGHPIIVPDENDSYNAMLDLKRIINEAHKALHGVNFDTQWRSKERFFSAERIKILLSELALPYHIKSEGTKEKRTITVTKQDSNVKIKMM